MNLTTTNRRRGFTLVEMIGVLAVIAVLAGLLIPRVFSTIAQSRINASALGYNSLKSAALLYFGKHGTFGAASPTFGQTLVTEQFAEKPFQAAVAQTATIVPSIAVPSTATPVAAAIDGTDVTGYILDGTGANNQVVGATMVQAVLTGVTIDDAQQLSFRIDGSTLSQAENTAGPDLNGRVKYGVPESGLTTVYLYVAHK